MLKYCFALLFWGLIAFSSQAQARVEKRFTCFQKDCDSTNATGYEELYYNGGERNGGLVKEYNLSNALLAERNYANIDSSIRHGLTREYYTSGQLKAEINFKDGLYSDSAKTYYRSGQLKRTDFYQGGTLVEGKCFGSNGQDTTYFPLEQMPMYPGGNEALLKFVADNINYPSKARKKNVEGKVVVKFVIDENGDAIELNIATSVSPEIDAEALRIVQLMPKWSPGWQDGVAVRVQFNLPIRFKLQ